MTQTKSELEQRKVVSKEEWVNARKAHLAKEKEFTRLRDQLSAERRQLPWVKVDKEYVFDGPDGKKTLSELFEGRSQLFLYHFMWLWDREEGCPSCSFVVDSMSGDIVHLENHDVKFVAVSRAPWQKLEGFQKRMGWKFDMLSSFNSDFNFDFNVSFTEEEMAAGKVYYNYGMQSFPSNEAPGASVFYKDEAGDVYHTYSSYTRGLDILLGAYNVLDMTPKGRNEVVGMEWVRHHDKYENAEAGSCCH